MASFVAYRLILGEPIFLVPSAVLGTSPWGLKCESFMLIGISEISALGSP